MNTIFFSHKYPKLHNQTKANLINIKVLDYNELHKDLIEYDTSYESDGKKDYYPLPRTKLIQLVFLGNKGIPFCTIRRYTETKYSYYLDQLREEFKIITKCQK